MTTIVHGGDQIVSTLTVRREKSTQQKITEPFLIEKEKKLTANIEQCSSEQFKAV